jgi:RNA polymerase sigma-70 factor, ECF subfamily
MDNIIIKKSAGRGYSPATVDFPVYRTWKRRMDQKTEAEIIARILKGERQSYARLVEEYKVPIYNLAFRMTGNSQDADDLAQETFVRAYQQIRRFDPKKGFFTWLYTIGLNLIRNHLKRKLFQNPLKTMDVSSYGAPEVENKESDDNFSSNKTHQLEVSLQKLPVDLRETIVLRFYQDLSFEEIAAIAGASVSAVKMRVYRALAKLKELLESGKS